MNLHASAIGVGIANAIFATDNEPTDAAAWIHFCVTAAEEAHAEVLRNPPLETTSPGSAEIMLAKLQNEPPPRRQFVEGAELTAAAKAAATWAFRSCMPKLTNRRSVQCFIACATVGMLHGYITGKETNALLYAANAALTAHPKRTRTHASKGQKRK